MAAYVFPGQGAQFPGMGKDLYENNPRAKNYFRQADEVLGFALTDVMFNGTEEDLKATKITQPAIFTHSIATLFGSEEREQPDAVAGHSLGEFSALVAAGALDFASALRLVRERAEAMQEACDNEPGTMAAILGLDDDKVEAVCERVDAVVVPANYNSPGQLVISGSKEGVAEASEMLTSLGARKVVQLPVGGAFHSPLMQPAKERLQAAIEDTFLRPSKCPIYQNFDAKPSVEPDEIRRKLIAQLTGPVRWTQTIQNMAKDGYTQFEEAGGKGKVLAGLIRKIDRDLNVVQMEAPLDGGNLV
ncbi:MAG: ACP S-malonyltransferase [Bacteroidota bacterium]